MKERPILFSGAMVRAILNGSKTQTRRVLKHQPVSSQTWGQGQPRTVPGKWCVHARFALPHSAPLVTDPPNSDDAWYPCPYGVPGDRLWVRETFHILDRGTERGEAARTIVYKATGCEIQPTRADHPIQAMKAPKAYPSIFMPRWASRITLEIVSVRVERLQSISQEDAITEGIEPLGLSSFGMMQYRDYSGESGDKGFHSPRSSYESLWESINGPGSWDANQWVWVVEFKKVEATK